MIIDFTHNSRKLEKELVGNLRVNYPTQSNKSNYDNTSIDRKVKA